VHEAKVGSISHQSWVLSQKECSEILTDGGGRHVAVLLALSITAVSEP
jgi:hypothetical protein